MGEQVGILDAETSQEHLPLVSLPVAIGVAQKDDVVPMLDDRAILIRQHAFGDGEPVREDARLLDAGGEGMVEDDDLVTGLRPIERFGGGGVFVRVDRILQAGARPSPAMLVEDEHDELPHLGAFLSDELDLKAFRQVEELLLLLRGTAGALHVVVADVLLLRSFRRLSRRGGL